MILFAVGLSACAVPLTRHIEFTPQHSNGLILLHFGYGVLPLPDDVGDAGGVIAPQRNWGVREIFVVPLDGAIPVGDEIRVRPADHPLGTQDPSLQQYSVPGEVVPSSFLPISLPQGRYAVTRLRGMPSTTNMDYVWLEHCMLAQAPVFEVRAGMVGVLDLFDIPAPVPSIQRPDVLDRAQRLLREYPGVSATAVPVHITEAVSLPKKDGSFCRLT